MFRNHFVSFNTQHNSIRNRYNTPLIRSNNNTLLNERNINIPTLINDNDIMNDMTAGAATTINSNENVDEETSEEELDEYERSESDEYETNEGELFLDEMSEWERNIINEENEGESNIDDEESDGNETSEEEDLDEEIIVDKPLDSEQMPRTVGDFAPYFNNITETLLFCWIQKHNICMFVSFFDNF